MLPVNVFHPDESEADFPGRRTVMGARVDDLGSAMESVTPPTVSRSRLSHASGLLTDGT